jgi:RNA polymerase sigma-54 factor
MRFWLLFRRKKQYRTISSELNISIDEVEKISKFFSENLNPFPARAHWGTFRQPAENERGQLSNPDVVIRYLNNNKDLQLIVEILTPNFGNLTVNPLYQNAIKTSEEGTKEKLKEDFNRANLFIKCIQQRNNTMLRLMKLLVKIQKEFIRHGDKHIIPVTRVQISKELDVHESTISRAVSNKLVLLPTGQIIPMSTFFDRSLGIRAELKEIINQEEKTHPFSDADLVKELNKRGHNIARRTVAKYRALEGILAAHQRRLLK